jgi:hypothetical protein
MRQISLSMTGYFDKGKKTKRERPFGDGIDRGHSDVMGVKGPAIEADRGPARTTSLAHGILA